MIERGQTEAIQLVRDTVNSRSEMLSEGNMGNATTTVPPLVYVDEDGLEEQFLMEDEATQEIAEVTANRVTTPVEPADVAPWIPVTLKDLNKRKSSTYNHPEAPMVKAY